MNLTHRIFMKYGVYGMNRIWSIMRRFLLIGLLVTILPFFMMPGFDVSAEDYIAPDPPETINLFGDKLHPVYIGTIGGTDNSERIYTTQESIDNLLSFNDYDGKSWDVYIIEVPGTVKIYKLMESAMMEDVKQSGVWLSVQSLVLWGTGLQAVVSDDEVWISRDKEYYNVDGQMLGFEWMDDGTDYAFYHYGDETTELAKLITDFINKQYKEHKYRYI